MKPITESIIEQSAIETLQAQGWAYVNGKDISPEGTFTNSQRLGNRNPTAALLSIDSKHGKPVIQDLTFVIKGLSPFQAHFDDHVFVFGR